MNDLPTLIANEAQAQGVDPALALGLWRAEGSGDMSAVSPKGAIGPMQLMPATARDLGVDPNTLQGNIRGGVTYLKQQLDEFGRPELAYAAYNAGPQAVRSHGGIPPYAETQAYVRRAMSQPDGPTGDDIFGMSSPAAASPQSSAPQSGSGEDIFASGPPGAQASAVPSPLGLATSAATPAPLPMKPWTLGLLKGVLPAAEKMAPYTPLALIPGFKDAETAAIGRLKSRMAASEAAGVSPNKTANFTGNLAATGWIPGGPALTGAASGYLNSTRPDIGGQLADAGWGAIGGKAGAMVFGLPGRLLAGSSNPSVRALADAGVPLTIGQAAQGAVKSTEDALTSVPVLKDIIKSAQSRGLEGVNRAAWNDALAQVGEQLPKDINIGRDAYTYTKGRLGDLYNSTLSAIGHVSPDVQFAQDLIGLAPQIAKLPDNIAKQVQDVMRLKVQPVFQNGMMSGEALKDAQEALGNHIRDLMRGDGFSRDGAAVLQNVKSSLEGLASRASPAAGDMLRQINKAYSYFKPLENAASSPASVNGIFPLGTLAQGVAKGKSKATLAAGNAPLQDLANAAKDVLPSSVPNSGTADRGLMAGLLGMLAGGGHHLPVVGPALAPVGLFGGASALLYSRPGQQLISALARTRGQAVQRTGEVLKNLSLLGAPAGAVAVTSARQ